MKNTFYTVLLVTFFFGSNARSQNTDHTTGEIIIIEPDQIIKTEIFIRKNNIAPSPDLFYHWYDSGKMIVTQGGYQGKLLHGKFTSAYLNKNLKEQGIFRYGLKNKTWTSWYESGRIKNICHWKKGMLHGISTSYDAYGNKEKKEKYRKGKMHGKQIIYTNGKTTMTRYRRGKEIILQENKRFFKPSFLNRIHGSFRKKNYVQ